ncbi:MAG: pantoate--beta-alanine ligase [Planctomycetaceae bacterium]|nr:pantoate--beta-alanine ligase [Planctomycetaceae bacterium]
MLIHDIAELRQALDEKGAVGFVPTMGALHEGHLSLVREAKKQCECVVVSIFVNPTQFGPSEDFSKYPRSLESDCELLRRENVDFVFAPAVETVYPKGFETYVEVGSVAEPLEGRFRPGHFRGVASVVLKLFNMVRSDAAFFGQKDFQQVRVIQKMIDDLNVPVRLVVCPTVRESDGLAMSSRNRYLTPQQREDALVLYRCLTKATLRICGEQNVDLAAVRREMEQMILAVKGAGIDYVSFADPQTLQEVHSLKNLEKVVLLLAVRIGTTRLIDNRVMELGDH